MRYIVMDLEWNQPLTPAQKLRSPVSLTGEIIQIGAVKLGEGMEYLDCFKLAVKPKVYTRLQEHVRLITGLTNDALSHGCAFPAAVSRFLGWCGTDCVLLTWGCNDAPILRENMELHRMEPVFPPVYNLQTIFNAQIAGGKEQWSLANALEKLQIENNRALHDALNDSMNTAELCKRLDVPRWLAEHAGESDQPKKTRPAQESYFHGYHSSGEILRDSRVSAFLCPGCGKAMRFGGWLRQNFGKEIAMASCATHGEYLAKLRIRKSKAGEYSAVRTLYRADDEMRALYRKHNVKRRQKAPFPPQGRWNDARKTMPE